MTDPTHTSDPGEGRARATGRPRPTGRSASELASRIRDVIAGGGAAAQADGSASDPEADLFGAAVNFHGFKARPASGRRTVFYLPPDVLDYLNELNAAADAAGVRLSKSSIVAQLVRRFRSATADLDTFHTRPPRRRSIPPPRHPREL